MVKCKLRKDGNSKYTIKGDVKTVAVETLSIIKAAYQKTPPLERALFKHLIVANLCTDYPIWNDVPEKSESAEPSNHSEKSKS